MPIRLRKSRRSGGAGVAVEAAGAAHRLNSFRRADLGQGRRVHQNGRLGAARGGLHRRGFAGMEEHRRGSGGHQKMKQRHVFSERALGLAAEPGQLDEVRPPGTYRVRLEGNDLPAGVYFVEVRLPDRRVVQRIVKQ